MIIGVIIFQIVFLVGVAKHGTDLESQAKKDLASQHRKSP